MIENYLTGLFDQQLVDNLAILIPVFLQLLGLVLAVQIDTYISRRHKRLMLGIAALLLALMLQNILEYQLVLGEPRIMARTLTATCGYIIRPVVLVLFLHIVSPAQSWRPAWIALGINTAGYLINIFTGICFSIREDNHYTGGPLGDLCLIISIALLAALVFVTVIKYSHVRKRELVIPLFNAVLIVLSLILDGSVGYRDQIIAYLTEAMISSSVFFYIWLNLQFVREHEEDLKARQQIQIMMTQIQPHFLYNTLTTIQALCRMDPEKASEVTERFGVYLRQNIDSLNQTELVPLQKELDHTKVYAEIEMVRFPKIRIRYDIQDEDILVPPLTIQPLVENAIRHGVRIRKDGLVTVRTVKRSGWHEIAIEDNGKGFDVAEAENAGSEHIGIRNVRERIEKMCGGTLTISSRIGEGTTVAIRIPEKFGGVDIIEKC